MEIRSESIAQNLMYFNVSFVVVVVVVKFIAILIFNSGGVCLFVCLVWG